MSIESWRDHVHCSNGDNFRVNDTPRYTTFRHPGLNYSGFDKLGLPDILSLMELLTDVSSIGVEKRDKQGLGLRVMDYDRVRQNYLHFHIVTEYMFSRAMYNADIAKWPMEARVSFGGLGHTSLLILVELFAPGNPEPVVRRLGKSVFVSHSTRKASPCPDWLRESLQGKEEAMEDVRMDRLSRPSWAYVHSVKILNSDTDSNNHTHYTSYVRFGLDALYLALLEKSRERQAGNDGMKPNNRSREIHHSGFYIPERGEGHSEARDHGKNIPKADDANIETHDAGKNSAETGDVSTENDDVEKNTTNADHVYTDTCDALPAETGAGDISSNDVALEGGSESSPTKALKRLTEDIMKNRLKTIKISYLSESVEGDDLNVFVWQGKDEERTVQCSIESKDGLRIHNQMIFEYFPPLSHL